MRRALLGATAACAVAASLTACGGDKTLDADSPPTTRKRFPAAVVSTTTPSTTPFGGVVPKTTTTTRKVSGGTTAPTTTTTTSLGGRVKPSDAALPTGRTGAGGAAWEGLVVVVGGAVASGSPSARVDAFNPVTGQWLRAPSLPVALRDAAVAVLGGDLWVVGGYATAGDSEVAQTATYVFHPGDTEWQAGPALTTARGGAALAALGSFLVAVGGQGGDGAALATVEVLQQGTSEWKATTPLPAPRAYASALALNGRIYVAGGRPDAVSSALDSVASWRGGATTWRTESKLDAKRAGAGAADNCVAGGQNGDGVVTTVECFGSGFWAKVAQLAAPRYGAAVVALDGWLHVIGGSVAGGAVSAVHEVIDLANV